MERLTSEPNYEERKHFYLFGLIGEHRIDVTKVCKDSQVTQMQTQRTPTDVALSIFTGFVYSPHTAKVWCE